MEKKHYEFRHPSQLNGLSTLPVIHRSGLGRLSLDSTFQHENKAQFERDLNRNYYACGCSEGAKGLLLGLFIFGWIGIVGMVWLEWTFSHTLCTVGWGTFTTAIAGKLIGLLMANAKLKKTIRNIQSVWKPEWPESTIPGCG